MHIVVVGLSHKTAPVEIREKLAVPESRLGEALTRLCGYTGIKEGMLLSTCNPATPVLTPSRPHCVSSSVLPRLSES